MAILVPLLAAFITLESTGCSGMANASSTAGVDTLFIGVAAAMNTGKPYFDGVALAVERLNKERPKGARPFGLRMPPEIQETQVAVAAAFRDAHEVIGVVGHTGSAQTVEAAPIYADVEHGGRSAVIAITPTATNPAVTRQGGWVFRVCPTDVDGARTLARYVSDSLDVNRIAVIYRNDLFGRGFLRVLSGELDSLGVEIMERDPYLAGITPFDAYASRLAGRSPDLLVFAGGGADAAELLRELRRLGSSLPAIGTDDMATLEMDSALAREFAGVRYTRFYSVDANGSAESARFKADFEAAYGTEPSQQSALSYDAAMLIGRAAIAVGGDRRRIRDWVAGVGSSHEPYEGVTGTIRFDDRGDAVGKAVYIGRVRP